MTTTWSSTKPTATAWLEGHSTIGPHRCAGGTEGRRDPGTKGAEPWQRVGVLHQPCAPREAARRAAFRLWLPPRVADAGGRGCSPAYAAGRAWQPAGPSECSPEPGQGGLCRQSVTRIKQMLTCMHPVAVDSQHGLFNSSEQQQSVAQLDCI